ncbi:hypothetical protein DL93DRAFT_2100200 [Clavulina sp. PMI_390]|nr:hypothetical protein DL93DRAFT_2100200 [Clavulina sp. PMI_390]
MVTRKMPSESETTVEDACRLYIPPMGDTCFFVGFELSGKQIQDLAFKIARCVNFPIRMKMFDPTSVESLDEQTLLDAIQWINFAFRKLPTGAPENIRLTILSRRRYQVTGEATQANRPVQLLTKSFPLYSLPPEGLPAIEENVGIRAAAIDCALEEEFGFNLLDLVPDMKIKVWKWPPLYGAMMCKEVQSAEWSVLKPRFHARFEANPDAPQELYEAYYEYFR